MRGYAMDRTDYLNRLRRIEGQVRGLQNMIAKGDTCIDLLTQIASVSAALQGVAVGLVDEHLRHCVAQAAETSNAERDDKLIDAVRAVERLVRI